MDSQYIVYTREGLDLIKRFEGLRLKAYKPQGEKTTKYLTIGYGHYGVCAGDEITEEEAHRLLVSDLSKVCAALDKLVTRHIDKNLSSALVSLAYNIGVGRFAKSSVLTAVNNGSPLYVVADAFMRYIYSGKTVLKGLRLRREAEVKLFLK
nr:MAG TPA: Lysozyme [Microviridae sp.]